jgi:hypothetical protein
MSTNLPSVKAHSRTESLVLNGAVYAFAGPILAHVVIMVTTLLIVMIGRNPEYENLDRALTTIMGFMAVLMAMGVATFIYGVLPALITGLILGGLRRLSWFAQLPVLAHAMIAAGIAAALFLALVPLYSTAPKAMLHVAGAFSVSAAAIEYLRSKIMFGSSA